MAKKKKSTQTAKPALPPLTYAPVLPAKPLELAEPGHLSTAKQVEAILGVRRSTIYRAARMKRISVYKFGKRGSLFFRLDELLSELKSPTGAQDPTTGQGTDKA